MALDENGEFSPPLVVQTSSLANGNQKITYFDMTMNPTISVEFDLSFETIIINRLDTNARVDDCEQKTVDCIDHVYTKMSWWSVITIVETTLIPATGVVWAGVCAFMNCIVE